MWIQVEILHFAMLKEACQSNSVVGQVRLFANDNDVVFSALRVELHDFLAIRIVHISLYANFVHSPVSAHMKAIPTMPKPTTTIFFRCEGSLEYFSVSFSSLLCPPAGSRLIAVPGEDVAQDILS
jgi:hypothetical protein